MNYLLIANNDRDGVGQPAVNLCRSLANRGHKSKLIVLHKFSKTNSLEKLKER